MIKESNPKMNLEVGKFLNNVYHDSNFERKLRDVKSIISLKDLVAMQRDVIDADIVSIPLRKEELDGILRSVKDQYGTEVYSSSHITIDYSIGGNFMNSQTFLEDRKVHLNIPNLNRFFNSFGMSGVGDAPASVIKLGYGGEFYAAIYMPPIIEIADKSYVEEPLEHLRRRAEKCPIINMDVLNFSKFCIESTKINLNHVAFTTEKFLSESNGSVAVLRDGAHRAYIGSLSGAPMPKIVINGSEAELKSVPISPQDMYIVMEKPKQREDRFLGLHYCQGKEAGWIELGEVGIDG